VVAPIKPRFEPSPSSGSASSTDAGFDRKPYEARYRLALQKRQAPLLAFAAKASA
jgi:hypothetical protein